MTDSSNLIDVARSRTIGVVGGSLSGLIVAWECAKIGMTVTVWEQEESVGGGLRAATVGGVAVTASGTDSFAKTPGMEELLTELGLSALQITPETVSRWLDQTPAVPLPHSYVWGIPPNPFAPEVRAILGWRDVWRAYLDRLKPVLTIGREHSMGRLVAARQGRAVRDKLVAPHTRALLGLDPDDVLIDVAVPDLNGALTRAGNLSSAVRLLEPTVPFVGLHGGLSVLTDALRGAIEDLGGTISTATRVDAILKKDDGWSVTLRPSATAAVSLTQPAPAEAPLHVVTVSHLVVAADEWSGAALLSPLIPDLRALTSATETTVTMAVEGLAFSAPRGAGLFGAHEHAAVRRIDHVSAQWPAVLSERAPGRAPTDVVRVIFGPNVFDAHHSSLDIDAQARALAEASRAFGAPLTLVESLVDTRGRSLPRESRMFAEQAADVRAQISKQKNLDLVGAWVAGADVSDIVADARETAEKIRRSTLFPENKVDA